MEPYFIPANPSARILILSESTYDWLDDKGNPCTPGPTHPADSIDWNIENFGKVAYFTALNRALCRSEKPNVSQMRDEWAKYAYTIYVQESMGLGPARRPKEEEWLAARSIFSRLLYQLRPVKVIATGIDMWNSMPECQVYVAPTLQAYRLEDESLIWCLAVPHPSNRRGGFNWRLVGESIQNLVEIKFPHTLRGTTT